MDVEELLNEKGFSVERRQIIMSENLKTLGAHKIQLRLLRDVVIELNGGYPRRRLSLISLFRLE